jgi:hypothetical protein
VGVRSGEAMAAAPGAIGTPLARKVSDTFLALARPVPASAQSEVDQVTGYRSAEPGGRVRLDDPPLHIGQRRRLAALQCRNCLVEREPGPGEDRAHERRHVRPADPGITAISHRTEATHRKKGA